MKIYREVGTLKLITQCDKEGYVRPVYEIEVDEAEFVRHGHNIRESGGGVFFCSVCGYINDDTWSGGTADFNYCPNCGARIDEVTE